GLQLGEDLLVRVALADAGLKLRQRLRVDCRDRPVPLSGHANQLRAFWRNRKYGRTAVSAKAPLAVPSQDVRAAPARPSEMTGRPSRPLHERSKRRSWRRAPAPSAAEASHRRG